MHGIDLEEAQILAANSSSPYDMGMPTTDTAACYAVWSDVSV